LARHCHHTGLGQSPTADRAHRFLKGLHYNRTDCPMVQVAPGKYYKWREALLTQKKIVLTDDEWVSDTEVRRLGYIAIFGVTDIEISPDDTAHSFKLSSRIK
jgi:hypothetical protein